MKTARLLITDTVMLNTGDAAILIGLVRALHEAFGETIELDVAELQPEAARRLYPGIPFGPTLHTALVRWAGKERALKRERPPPAPFSARFRHGGNITRGVLIVDGIIHKRNWIQTSSMERESAWSPWARRAIIPKGS